jgi:hypothetical protein
VQDKFPELVVKTFDSIGSPEFEEHLRSVGVYFVMCHNGVVHADDGDDDEDEDEAGSGDEIDPDAAEAQRKWLLVIRELMSYDFNVAMINEIEWRDTKVCYIHLKR